MQNKETEWVRLAAGVPAPRNLGVKRLGATVDRFPRRSRENQRLRAFDYAPSYQPQMGVGERRTSPLLSNEAKTRSHLCATRGNSGETYTLHSPKNLLPTAANQMNFSTQELNVVGRWSSSSKMPERYDRSVCASELLLRNAIINRIANGRAMAPPFHLP